MLLVNASLVLLSASKIACGLSPALASGTGRDAASLAPWAPGAALLDGEAGACAQVMLLRSPGAPPASLALAGCVWRPSRPNLESPKSVSLRWPCWSISRLSGFMSRCTTPVLCRYSSPCTISARYCLAHSSGSPPNTLTSEAQSPPGRYSITRYRFSALWNVKKSFTTNGDCVRFMRIIRSARTLVIWFLAIMSDLRSTLTAYRSPVARFRARNTDP